MDDTPILAEVAERIRQATERLGSGGRSVAELVLSRPEEVALSPAARVAKRLGVSESTVVRFATTIGYPGYPALRRVLQDQVRHHLNPSQRLERYAERHGRRRATLQSFKFDLEDLTETQRTLAPASLAAAVHIISLAKETYVLGLRGSFGLAYTLYHQLNQTLSSVRLMDPGRGELIEQLAHIGPRDVLVGITVPRYTRLTIETMELAGRQNAKIIAITDGPLSPAAKHADVVLTAHCSARPFANSNIGALTVINAVVEETALKNRKRAVNSLERLEKMLRAADVLFDPEC